MKSSRPQYNLIEVAAGIVGNQAELARLCKVNRATITKARDSVAAGEPIKAELAKAIERATKGAVPAYRFRPDLWDAPEAKAS